MNDQWHFYDPQTGVFSGGSYIGPVEFLGLNTPPGAAAFKGEFVDVLAKKVGATSGELVDYQPPAPTDTEAETWAWNASTKRWISSPTQAAVLSEAKTAYETAAQAKLDALAQSWGYDNIISAASYAASAVPRFKAEADALIAWRDALWTAAYAIEAAVVAGTQQLPATAEAFLALLPSAPVRPGD